MRYFWAAIIGIILFVAGTSWWMIYNMGRAMGSSTETMRFTVATGQKLRSVAVALEHDRLIPSASAWTLYAILQGQRSAILSGVYELRPTMTGREILRNLTTQPLNENEVSVTIVEGMTLTKIADQLERVGVVNGQAFLNLLQHPVTSGFDVSPYRIARQKPTAVDFEGYVFPDTYRFFKHSNSADILKRVLGNLDVHYTVDLEQATISAGHTPHEILTLASILEAELQTSTDRAKAADLFWRRLKIGMGLNADTTILYALGRVGGSVSTADLKVDSPYNTYLNRGLPPGPINNPGLDAIRTAITPTPNDYLYYLSGSDGTTYFAITLDEHNQNKAKYLK